MATPSSLPSTPVKHSEFISYVASNPSVPLVDLLEPFKEYDAKLREVFAQEPDHPALEDPYLNIAPVYSGHEQDLKIRARNLSAESQAEKDQYVMPLKKSDRLLNGSPAVVENIKDFQQNFSLFCESSLVDLDWSNVVAAGSSVVTCLLPVPEKYKVSKRALRQYYHETIAPASDVDLFIYGLSEEDAINKIIQIEQQIKDSILTETTTIRTKNAITIASQYPTRHIQIVLRIYKSVAEILTGFDVDCSCAAYDGQQVYAAPRALTAYMTQVNTIDLTRRSPSYENRLSKYSHRGFEVHWPYLDRSKIDPTIYERHFGRTVGLARLLVLERLPTKSERESYMDERRLERGRPPVNRGWDYSAGDNIKDRYEDEVAEWVSQEDVSDYHTFTIPYGPKYHAKKIEKLLYTKDLLLNAEWNKKDDREVNLHRHPAFFGYAKDVINDCCGFCPEPVTPEEHDVAEEEAKIYVSGAISFIKDDPGRQAIGSFHPITDDDWTEMAYVGNTARLCQAIIDEDLEHVQDWLSQEGSDPNTRDYTGRTPLHLAVISSTPAIVKALIDGGARLVARLADGRTALHLAAARGNVEMLRMILQKSEENEEQESKKEETRMQARMAARAAKSSEMGDNDDKQEPEQEDEDIEMVDEEDEDVEMQSIATGSFVDINRKEAERKAENLVLEEDEDEPDVYDVNVLSWDWRASPLHLAILNGHIECVKELVQNFGADVLLPIKLLDTYDKSPRGAILTLALAMNLPLQQAKAMTKTLLEIGGSCAQADLNQTTALHYISGRQPDLIETVFEFDGPAAKRALNHLAVHGSQWYPQVSSPLISSIAQANSLAALKLLENGALPSIDFKTWIKSVERKWESFANRDAKHNHQSFERSVEQPVITAAQFEMPDVVLQLLSQGIDPSTITKEAQDILRDDWNLRYHTPQSLLDIVQEKVRILKNFEDDKPPTEPTYKLEEGVDYLGQYESNTYKGLIARIHFNHARKADKRAKKSYEEALERYNDREGILDKKEAIAKMATEFEKVEQKLLELGAKTFKELHPKIIKEKESYHDSPDDESEPLPWAVEFDFSVYDLDEEDREGYLMLFQAAWDGDLPTIKALTLAQWGPNKDRIPLKIAVEDRDHLSPFSLAVLRGNSEVAKAILEICFTQYHPETEQEKAVYNIGAGESDYDSDEEVQSDDRNTIPVYSRIVDAKFTIDNIGEVSKQVKSKISPLTLMDWTFSAWEYAKFCEPNRKFTYGLGHAEIKSKGREQLIDWALITNDSSLFKFLLDTRTEWTKRLANKSEDTSVIPAFSDADFVTAIKWGRLEMLADLIKRTGAGMELESLVEKSGVEFKEKPKFYQGLSVHGTKREDWVSAARGVTQRAVTETTPPLLRAAWTGSLESVEWFLSGTPARHYLNFAENNKNNKLIEHLNTAGGGFENVLHKWLNARRDLALHCAVLAEPNDETSKLIQYLIKAMPQSLELKSRSGYTPLLLAFAKHRYEAAQVLIEAGADQTARDKEGSNILHHLLGTPWPAEVASDELQKFLNLVDRRLVPSLLRERCSSNEGSQTPLASWLNSRYSKPEGLLRTFLEFASSTNNEHLELLDGSGETPLHWAVKETDQESLKIMLEYRPDLLYRENSVGRTPYEIAEDKHIEQCVLYAPSTTPTVNPGDIVHIPISEFAKRQKSASEASLDKHESIWRLCEKEIRENPQKRRLVSLLDANEVAKRLGNRKRRRSDEDSSNDCRSERDEVDFWL